VICEHPNGAAATSHTVFSMDRGVPWERAIKLLEDEGEQGRGDDPACMSAEQR